MVITDLAKFTKDTEENTTGRLKEVYNTNHCRNSHAQKHY